ncbi:hypothetical protein NDU88_000422 [Pleurodeles waltl]|uniref:Uncharacterized protein n=1 Tax=Pleurodeles waltl TaxID=8319 RepID=A0AAV7N9K2_PLEWA|nr:hypothetical protein NDU88_000422 [Pleurodeles waltl]
MTIRGLRGSPVSEDEGRGGTGRGGQGEWDSQTPTSTDRSPTPGTVKMTILGLRGSPASENEGLRTDTGSFPPYSCWSRKKRPEVTAFTAGAAAALADPEEEVTGLRA